MTDLATPSESVIRLGIFLSAFAFLAVWERITPKRARSFTRWVRWPSNLGIAVLNTILLRVLFPVAAIGLAVVAEQREWGLLNNLDLPSWLAVFIAVILLDLAIYLQHVLFHAVPLFWRLHRMHHTDLDFDVTTAIRFHPIEILLSMGIKMAVVAALGAPALSVLIFEVLLNATAMFNHGNIRIPTGIDKILRLFVVTPDMHRVHHSIIRYETNSNFGFNFPWWDRVFGTYRAQPEAGHENMTIGIEQFREDKELRIDKLLTQPFRGPAVTYPIGRGQNP